MDPISDPQIEKLLQRYDVSVSAEMYESIRAYISMLLLWNKKISLTTVVDPVEIVKFHFGESLFAVHTIPISRGRLADVGSGAGFPGLPLAMLLPDLEVILVDSNLKKATFLSDAIRKLHLSNANVWHGRIEHMPLDKNWFDFVTARALGHYQSLLKWSGEALGPFGKVVLWVGDDDAAAISATPSWVWRSPVWVPGSERRVLLSGSPLLP